MRISSETLDRDEGRPMRMYRLHVRPSGGSANMATTFAYLLSEGVLGVGWRTPSNINTKDWATYFEEASTIHADLSVCLYIRNNVQPGDLIWARDTRGSYYLAKVVTGWEYLATDEAVARDIDVANVVRVDILSVAIDEVPGKVVAAFRATRSIQAVLDATALEFSKFLWNRAHPGTYEIDPAIRADPDIFSLLDAEEVEDLVFIYLQREGWIVVPQSRKVDTIAFEYQVVDPKTGAKAQVQVKTGWSGLDRDAYALLPLPVILFQSHDRYTGRASSTVTCLERAEIESFLARERAWLPARYGLKRAMLAGV